MSIRDIQLAAREQLMLGLQLQLSRMLNEDADPVVYQRAAQDFRRIEKFLGFEPESWRIGV